MTRNTSPRWHLVQLTPEAALAHDRRVYNVPADCGLGWTPYLYRATYGAVAQWACYTEAELHRQIVGAGLTSPIWGPWDQGVRYATLTEATR